MMSDLAMKRSEKIEISMPSFTGNSENTRKPNQKIGIFLNQNQNGVNTNQVGNNEMKIDNQVENFTIENEVQISKPIKTKKQDGKNIEKFSIQGSNKMNEKFKEFKELLRIVGATSTWRWEDARRMLHNDPRARILKTLKEQKQAFNEYIREYKLRFKKELNEKRQHLRDEFIEMLKENNLLSSASKYYDSAKYFFSDPRFSGLDEKTREEIFQDYLDDLEKEERDELAELRSKRIKNLISFFEEKKVPIEMTFDECKKTFGDNPIFKGTEDNEILKYF